MSSQPLRVLFLCTGNSARSQLAEAILRHLAKDWIDVGSAGSTPQPEIHPMARASARKLLGVEMVGQHPKRLDQFLRERFDYVITVCDRAAESCQRFLGTCNVFIGASMTWQPFRALKNIVSGHSTRPHARF